MSERRDRGRDATELLQHLETVRLDDVRALEALTDRLAEIWGGQAAAYRPKLAGPKWGVEFIHAAGVLPAGPFQECFRAYMATAPVHWSLYNPLRPEPEQRNQVWGDKELPAPEEGASKFHVMAHFYKRAGIFGLSQMRTLVCDGPVLLAWVGGFRERPFGAEERALLQRLVEPLQRRLRVERLLTDHGATSGGLVAALDEIPSPAMLVTEDATVHHANAAALKLLDLQGLALGERVRRALEEPRSEPALTLTPLEAGGLPRHFLVVLRGEAGNVALRLALFEERWTLTPKQREVLLMLVRGEPNKVIADKLGVALVTVENHVTALLRKARVENRASLVARFWTGA